MSNNISAGIGEQFSAVLQSELYDSYIGAYISNTKFEGAFVGNDTVHFPRFTKLTVKPLVSSYDTITTEDVVLQDETFILDKRYAGTYKISDEDYIEMKVNPDGELIQSMKQAFAQVYDDAIFSEYASAGLEITDGDMSTATNGGGTASIILSKTNIYDLVTAVSQKMDENDIPTMDRWIAISPKEKRLLANAPELLRSTGLGDKVVTGGFMGEVDGIKIYFSNNIKTAANIKHCLAGQGKPISFAANIRPQIQFIDSSSLKDEFVNYVKAQTKFGVKTFHEGAIRLIDINIKA